MRRSSSWGTGWRVTSIGRQQERRIASGSRLASTAQRRTLSKRCPSPKPHPGSLDARPCSADRLQALVSGLPGETRFSAEDGRRERREERGGAVGGGEDQPVLDYAARRT